LRSSARRLHQCVCMKESKEREKFHELVSTMKNAMLVTRQSDGQLHARPMMTADVSEDGTMTFITAVDSGKVEEILNDCHVGVTFQRDGTFLAVSGTAVVQSERNELQRVWTVGSEEWFDGVGASKAALIVVTPQFAEYWDNRGVGGLKYAFETVRAVVTGEEPRTSKEQHGSITA